MDLVIGWSAIYRMEVKTDQIVFACRRLLFAYMLYYFFVVCIICEQFEGSNVVFFHRMLYVINMLQYFKQYNIFTEKKILHLFAAFNS